MLFTEATAAPTSSPDKTAGLNNLLQLIELRWLAVLGQILTIAVVHYGLQIAIHIERMVMVLALLAAFNALAWLRWRMGRPVTHIELLFSLLVDVAALTAQLYLSGGASNPFVFLYLLQVILGAVLLPVWATWVLVAVTSSGLALLAVWASPLALPPAPLSGLPSLYLLGLGLCFVLNAVLLVVFITRIMANLRERDRRLAQLREHAAEEEHIVHMGLLASGAAHELGSPLSTLAVILGDWQHEARLNQDHGLAEDIREMQAQVQRCKTIVSDVLLSAGQMRSESSQPVAVAAFLDDVIEQWCNTNTSADDPGSLHYDNRVHEQALMVGDAMLRQMIYNLLDNARDASPAWQSLQASSDETTLRLLITDRGPGFAPNLLRRLGTAYQSSKGHPGGGLGLYLSMNVARKLGGHISVRNLPSRGAEVTVHLPLTRLGRPPEPTA